MTCRETKKQSRKWSLPRQFVDIMIANYFNDPISPHLPWKDLRSYTPVLQNEFDQTDAEAYVTTAPSTDDFYNYVKMFTIYKELGDAYLNPSFDLKNIEQSLIDLKEDKEQLQKRKREVEAELKVDPPPPLYSITPVKLTFMSSRN